MSRTDFEPSEPDDQRPVYNDIYSRIYMNGNVTTDKTKRKDLTKLEKEMTKIEQPQYPNMDSSSMGRLSQTQYLASVIKVCNPSFKFNHIPYLIAKYHNH